MANAAFHKRQAEALIKKYNDGIGRPIPQYQDLLGLAQIHALLANVPDEEE